MEQKYLFWAFQSSHSVTPTEQDLRIFSEKYKKDYEQRELYEGEELLTKFKLNSWRNPIFCEVTSVILAYEVEGNMRVKYITGDEKDLLLNFSNLLKNSFQEYILVHFDAEIVLPYIGVRLHNNGIINAPHKDLSYFGLRSWNFTGFDLKAYYQGGGRYSFSLEQIASILKIDSEGIILYEDEFTYFNSGRHAELKLSAIKRVEVMAEIFRKLKGLPKLNTILVEEEVKDIIEEQPKNILLELYNSNTLQVESAKSIKEKIGKKKLTKKDKENLYTILRGVLIKNDFINGQQDTKAIIAKKEKEVTDFISSL